MISNEDLINMCRKLAHKYNRPNDFDDIVSEGAIVCLELRAEDPEVHQRNCIVRLIEPCMTTLT